MAAGTINQTCVKDAAIPIAANARYRSALNVVEQAHSRAESINIVVGNAGVNPYFGLISTTTNLAYEKIIITSVQTNLWLSQLTVPDMIKKGLSSVICTASIPALKPFEQLRIYGMSKLSLIGLMSNLTEDFGPKEVRFNAICPRLIKAEIA